MFSVTHDLPGVRRAWVATRGSGDSSAPGGRLVVFFHGFVTSPSSYRTLLGLLIGPHTTIVAPQMYRRGPAALAGRPSVIDEATSARRVIAHVVERHAPRELWIAGHSRGGQVAWLVAEACSPAGVVVFDPVDGVGRDASELHAAARSATFDARTLVIGAGLGGRCAPAAVNHEQFARVGPPGNSHVVIPTMGHGDFLDDRPRRAARLLCGGSANPEVDRETAGTIARDFIERRADQPERGVSSV